MLENGRKSIPYMGDEYTYIDLFVFTYFAILYRYVVVVAVAVLCCHPHRCLSLELRFK